jgi:hypothetical protein
MLDYNPSSRGVRRTLTMIGLSVRSCAKGKTSHTDAVSRLEKKTAF